MISTPYPAKRFLVRTVRVASVKVSAGSTARPVLTNVLFESVASDPASIVTAGPCTVCTRQPRTVTAVAPAELDRRVHRAVDVDQLDSAARARDA